MGWCGWIFLFACAVATPAQERKPEGRGIDPASVAAYEKLGATYGGLVDGVFGFYFQEGPAAAATGLPTFQFQRDPKAKLPTVSVPFGLDLVPASTEDDFPTDASLKALAGLKNLSALYLFGSQVTDAGLKEVAAQKSLSTLSLYYTQVTDAGLKTLAGLKNLSALYLGGTEVTDTGLKELARLKKLSVLFLDNTRVSDAGLKDLARLKNLSTLVLSGTQVTEAGTARLRKALPKCVIHR